MSYMSHIYMRYTYVIYATYTHVIYVASSVELDQEVEK